MKPAASIAELFADVVGAERVLAGDAIGDDYTHDEALTATPVRPAAVVRPESTRAGRGDPARGARAARAGDRARGRDGPLRAAACRARTASSSRSSA